MYRRSNVSVLAIALMMAAAGSASAALIASPGSGQAGVDFAAITPTVTVESNNVELGDGASYDMTDAANFFDGDDGTFGYWGAYYWNDAAWLSVIIDFGQEVQIERIEALWTKHTNNYVIPDSAFRVNSSAGAIVQNISFTANDSIAGYPGSTVTDTGTLGSPVTLTKLVLYAPPGDHSIYGYNTSSWNELNITGQVPEPATLALLGMGAVSVLSRRRR